MPITSSTIAEVGTQRDGRRWVLERHVDHLGIEHVRHWLAQAADDLDSALAAYALRLLEELRDREIGHNVAAVMSDGRLAVTTTIYSTAMQNINALRAAYQSATRTEAIFVGDFLGSLTDAQLRNAFDITQGQVTTLRTNKLTPAETAATTIRAASGA
jgi:hypothetical protein